MIGAANLSLIILLLAPPAWAHGSSGSAAAIDGFTIALAAVALTVYLVGAVRAQRKGHRRPLARAACFVSGWSLLLVGLIPIVQRAAEHSFALHMAEHELLMLVVPLLLIAARPLGAFAWTLPSSGRWLASALLASSFLRVVLRPVVAWALQAIGLWVWHMPVLFEMALGNALIHFAQHVCFLATALLFWWSLFSGDTGPLRHGAALLSLFTTVLCTGLLGALLTVSPTPWYRAFPQGILPTLDDQQLAGLIMWVPGGILYIAAALWIAADWMRVAEARTRQWERASTHVL